MPLPLEDDQMCYVCGKKNSHGFHLNFTHPEKGRLEAEVVFLKQHQGFKDIVHGGMVSMLLDEMMVNLAWKEGVPAVTAQLSVRLKKPVYIGQKVLLEGRIDRQEPRALYTSATAKSEKGELLASATATCIKIKHHRINLEEAKKSG